MPSQTTCDRSAAIGGDTPAGVADPLEAPPFGAREAPIGSGGANQVAEVPIGSGGADQVAEAPNVVIGTGQASRDRRSSASARTIDFSSCTSSMSCCSLTVSSVSSSFWLSSASHVTAMKRLRITKVEMRP